jgi:hypothetical protein
VNPQEQQLADWVNAKFKSAYVAKAPYMQKWKDYKSAYDGTYFLNQDKPDYKSDQVSNFVFSIVETIRPIMTDNNPKFIALPRTPEGSDIASDIQMAFDFEWDRERMGLKLPKQLIPTLVYGTSAWFMPWDARERNVRCTPIDIFNIFPDALATDIDDAEYVIYATYKHENQLKKLFPEKAEQLIGASVKYSELVNERDKNAQDVRNQILTLEMWCRDYTTIEVEEQGQTKKVFKFPKGRVITCCPDLGIVLSDKENPYRDGKFPFVFFKNYDVPFEFWGKSEIEQLLSPQKYINDLNNQIIDNAKLTANMHWILDKNSGIGQGKLTNRPGLVIRKNPGTEVRREAPQPMPTYVTNKILELKDDMQTISGVHDSVSGQRESGITAAQAIMALQEASQARIRLKIKIMEEQLSAIANIWYSRLQQFWKTERWVRVTDIEGNVQFSNVSPDKLLNDFDVKVASGSTMPTNKNAMLDLMIRLAQTMAEDGLPVVDRKAILEFLPIGDKRAILKRMEEELEKQKQAQQLQQQVEQQTQQLQQKESEGQELLATVEQLSQVVQSMSKQVESINREHNQMKEKEEKEMIEKKGYEKGLKDGAKESESGDKKTDKKEATPTPEQDEPILTDEVVAMMGMLSDEELLQITEQFPELEDFLAQEAPQISEQSVPMELA